MTNTNVPAPKTIDEYITLQPEVFQLTLEKLRVIIRSAATQATEILSYSIPVFHDGYMLVGMGVSKKYVSFYTMSPGLVKAMKEEWKEIKFSVPQCILLRRETSIHTHKKIVKTRIEENKRRMQEKNRS